MFLETVDGDRVGGGVELDLAAGGATAGIEGVDDLFAMALVDDHAVHAKEAKVMANGGLGEFEFFAEAGDIAFTAGQKHNDLQTGAIREQPEELTEVVKGLDIRRLCHFSSTWKIKKVMFASMVNAVRYINNAQQLRRSTHKHAFANQS